jgi:hypothetical protein
VQQLLHSWGKTNIVTLVQMLPSRMWGSTALGYADIVQIHAPAPGCVNTRLDVRDSFFMLDQQNKARYSDPIPLITLQASSIDAWARMITHAGEAWVTGVIFDLRQPITFRAQEQELEILAEERVKKFQRMASPAAMQLACLLAAAPISLPVMRLIQSTLAKETSQVDLAEVFLGGLLRKLSSVEAAEVPDYVEYDFLDGVRDVLLNKIDLPRSFEIFEIIYSYIEQHFDLSSEYKALVSLPSLLTEKVNEVSINKGIRPFALIQAKLWRRLGGKYIDWAMQIEHQLALFDKPAKVEPEIAAVAKA